MAVTIENLKTLFPLSLEDTVITPHLARATWDYEEIELDEDIQQLEVIGSKTLYYLAPLLWVDMQNRADEYAESLETFKDLKKFQENWLDRANSALNRTNNDDESEIQCSAI